MKRRWLLCFPVVCIFMSCTKEPLDNMTEEQSRIYVTNYDTTVSFRNYSTFKIADSIAVIENNRLQTRQRTSMHAQIISAVASSLEQRGFVRVSGNQNADLGVTVSAITNTSTQLVSYTDYGGYYGSYWDPFYWGGSYSDYSYFFPTYYGVYETGETALAVDAVDLKNAAQNSNQLRVIWSGLVRGSGIFSGQNISSQVAALFAQSPYLNKNR